jgi:hypothetical protein
MDFYYKTSAMPFPSSEITWVAKKNQSICSEYLTDQFFFVTSSQSETLFTNMVENFNLQFDQVGWNLLRAISQSKLQYSQQYCNIQGTEHPV